MRGARYIVCLMLIAGAAISLSYVRANIIIDDVYYWPEAESQTAEETESNASVVDYPDPEYRHVKDDTVPAIRFTLIQDTVVKAVIHRP